tara:strand:- start:109 stop:1044 length:936 start_codon:yes stop_codon:yes gene_type:complete
MFRNVDSYLIQQEISALIIKNITAWGYDTLYDLDDIATYPIAFTVDAIANQLSRFHDIIPLHLLKQTIWVSILDTKVFVNEGLGHVKFMSHFASSEVSVISAFKIVANGEDARELAIVIDEDVSGRISKMPLFSNIARTFCATKIQAAWRDKNLFENVNLPYFVDHVVDDERHEIRFLHAPRPMLASMLKGGVPPALLPLPTIPSGVKDKERYSSYLASRSLASPLSSSFSFLTFVDKEKQTRNKLSAPVGDLIEFSKKYKDIFGLGLFNTIEILKFVAAYLGVEEWKPLLGESLVAYALKLDNLYSARAR